MFNITPIVPAYGRDYSSKAALEADFNADKDFRTPTGQYINKAQLLELMGAGARVSVRYGKNRKVAVLVLKA